MGRDQRGDPVQYGFLWHQDEQGMDLSNASDLLSVVPLESRPSRAYVVNIRLQGLVQEPDGRIVESNGCTVGILFAEDHLRRVRPYEAVSFLSPLNFFHPNVKPPLICLGHITPGMGLVEIIYQVAQIVTYQNVNLVEAESLNKQACRWARTICIAFPRTIGL